MRSEQIKNQLEIVQGDITKLDCDCIVNAANRSLLGGGGIAEAFYGMPQKLRAETLKRLPEDLRAALFVQVLFCKGKAWYTEGGKSLFSEVKIYASFRKSKW